MENQRETQTSFVRDLAYGALLIFYLEEYEDMWRWVLTVLNWRFEQGLGHNAMTVHRMLVNPLFICCIPCCSYFWVLVVVMSGVCDSTAPPRRSPNGPGLSGWGPRSVFQGHTSPSTPGTGWYPGGESPRCSEQFKRDHFQWCREQVNLMS